MLKEKTPKELISPKPRPGMESTPVLSYVFKDKFLPAPIFHRLLAACVAKWPISKNAMSENLIYCGSCAFDIDLHHRLVVFFREYIIFTRVTRMGTTQRTPSLKQCIHVREFIEMTLSKIIGYLGQSLQFELFVRCPKSDGYGVDCLIPVADLQKNVDVPCNFHVTKNSHLVTSHEVLKFWFQDEEIQGNPGHLLSDQGLMYVASRLGAEWKFVALNLHLTQAEIDRIQMDMPGQTLGQIHKALSTWLNRSIRKDHKNVQQLLNAIEDVKRNDLALELKEKFHVQGFVFQQKLSCPPSTLTIVCGWLAFEIEKWCKFATMLKPFVAKEIHNNQWSIFIIAVAMEIHDKQLSIFIIAVRQYC